MHRRTESWRPWRIAIASRVLVLLVGCAATGVIADLPNRWDANWYVGLASRGYRWDTRPDRFDTIAFFPAYPMTLRAVTAIVPVPRTSPAWAWTGVVLSTIAFGIALTYLAPLAGDLAGPRARAFAPLAISLYPFSIWFGLPYTESFFLLAIVASCYHAYRQQWPGIAAFGALAGLTRPNGFLLTLPLLLIALWDYRRVKPDAARRRSRAALIAAFSPLAGMLLFSAFVWTLTGDPFTWAGAQSTWGRQFHGLGAPFRDAWTFIADRGLTAYVAQRYYDVLNGFAGLAVLLASWPVTRRLGAACGVMLVINLLPPLAVGGFPSMGRYTSVLFPLFIWLAAATPARVMPIVLAIFAIAQAAIAALFFTWRPMF